MLHMLTFLAGCASPPSGDGAAVKQEAKVGIGGQVIGPNGGSGSGGAMQDPSGFPAFHDWPAPKGPPVGDAAGWTSPKQLTKRPSGGYRPQIAIGSQGMLHVVYYDRADSGDILRHRTSVDGVSWTQAVSLGHDSDRNWGPDIVARPDGSVVVVYDHALADFTSRGYLTTWSDGSWSAPEPLTPDDGGEVGSGHVAHGVGDDLAYAYIGKKVGQKYKFQARYSWYSDGEWSSTGYFTDGRQDAWHTNVERRPDGSVLAGYDVGTGGGSTTLFLVDGRNGSFGKPENMTMQGKPGERPHFAFEADGTDHVAWFHKERGQPRHIYVRSGRPQSWGGISEPSAGFGGYHFDPDIAVNGQGALCLVWGWDAGEDAEMVYSIGKDGSWSPPRKVADVNWGKPGLASLSADAEGNFHLVWNQGVRGYNEIYYARLEAP
jgi:hypothetical protein